MAPIHPLVADPYIILSQIPEDSKWFTVLDLKDAFFTIPLHQDSQYLFAFECEDPFMRERQQYTWTVLPQGFRDSPHLFSRALRKDLRELQVKEGGLLQYVDDLLICSPTQDISNANTVLVLNFLTDRG
jgi:hypothetical protein